MSSSSSVSSNPNPWSPYETYKDCSQGICSIYCPQWCYIIFPPPPPSSFDDDSSIADFSPLVIAVIGILASAFILVTYYTLVSRYCKRRPHDDRAIELDPASLPRDPVGLDEALIKTITVRKYSKSDAFVEGTDCSVCLSEFQEDESLRLLPKCNHAFHLPCIDAWLKNQATCPLCRSDINPLPPRPVEHRHGNDTVLEVRDLERVLPGEEEEDLTVQRGTELSGNTALRRSVSLDSVTRHETPVRISDILEASDDDDDEDEDEENLGSGSSRTAQSREENSKSGNGGSRATNVVAMKRSSSTGRFTFSRYGKNRSSTSNTVHPSVDPQI